MSRHQALISEYDVQWGLNIRGARGYHMRAPTWFPAGIQTDGETPSSKIYLLSKQYKTNTYHWISVDFGVWRSWLARTAGVRYANKVYRKETFSLKLVLKDEVSGSPKVTVRTSRPSPDCSIMI